MRILGIDYGQKRIGIALSDETGTVAQGLEYIPGGSDAAVCQTVVKFAETRQAGKIVVGVPIRMNNTSSAQTERTLRFITALQAATSIPIERWDERFTSVQAERALIEGGVRRRDRREKIDKIAAQLMLQSYLDAQASIQ